MSELPEWLAHLPGPTEEPPGPGYVWNYETGEWLYLEKPYPSWVHDPETNAWLPPIPPPQTGDAPCVWDEDTTSWVEVTT